ncbi:class I SAM-dependent methyltransferase [Pseudomonas entomophila]|uniref:class I SAM-dependent methyltransferase n=1 Tax=Pseudomonas entomophila TaxID=312306 RepID=UPI0015E3CFB0|nr:class I SAM-dependent methyltransferase [Pseudomonas entomophila]MBA1189499.1 class I SAM-dependent methyltransferase [Pseudomonas entomophila]
MSTPAPASRNWFDQGGQAYASFRPDYPAALAAYLASTVTEHRLAVDVGCGNGQLTTLLADHFDTVWGFDPSQDQIAHAQARSNLHYACAPAEALPASAQGAQLITVAQAAHWFDLPAFYAQVRTRAAPGAVLALISYGVPRLEDDLQGRFMHFYHHEIGPFWPPERQQVDSGYATLDFPFAEFKAPTMSIELSWNLEAFLGYVSTWSAVRHAREAGEQALLERFAADLATCWGQAQVERSIRWPINLRIGQV